MVFNVVCTEGSTVLSNSNIPNYVAFKRHHPRLFHYRLNRITSQEHGSKSIRLIMGAWDPRNKAVACIVSHFSCTNLLQVVFLPPPTPLKQTYTLFGEGGVCIWATTLSLVSTFPVQILYFFNIVHHVSWLKSTYPCLFYFFDSYWCLSMYRTKMCLCATTKPTWHDGSSWTLQQTTRKKRTWWSGSGSVVLMDTMLQAATIASQSSGSATVRCTIQGNSLVSRSCHAVGNLILHIIVHFHHTCTP